MLQIHIEASILCLLLSIFCYVLFVFLVVSYCSHIFCSILKFHSFHFSLVRKRERDRERSAAHRFRLCALINRDWTRLKAWNSLVSPWECQGPKHLCHHLLPCRVYVSRKLEFHIESDSNPVILPRDTGSISTAPTIFPLLVLVLLHSISQRIHSQAF